MRASAMTITGWRRQMALQRGDFLAAPTGVQRNNAKARGWGDGWPHCQSGKWMKVKKAGVIIIVRREVAELVATLLQITEELGYDIKPGQTWGAACRPIRGTNAASNHSFALAVDINSIANPMGVTFKTDIPPRVVEVWWKCGWFWGGWYATRPDAMHFEYVHEPSDVDEDLATARKILAALRAPVPAPETKWRKRVNVKPGSRTVRRWDQGDDVALVQRFLGDKPDDGKFDEGLEKAVRGYQKMRGLKVDGVVGPVTWKPILASVRGA